MGLTRLELVTSRLSGVRSNQLSYRPVVNVLSAVNLNRRRVRQKETFKTTAVGRAFHEAICSTNDLHHLLSLTVEFSLLSLSCASDLAIPTLQS